MDDSSEQYVTIARRSIVLYSLTFLLIAFAFVVFGGTIWVASQRLYPQLGLFPALLVGGLSGVVFAAIVMIGGEAIDRHWAYSLVSRELRLVPFNFYQIQMKRDSKFTAKDNYGNDVSGKLHYKGAFRMGGHTLETYEIKIAIPAPS